MIRLATWLLFKARGLSTAEERLKNQTQSCVSLKMPKRLEDSGIFKKESAVMEDGERGRGMHGSLQGGEKREAKQKNEQRNRSMGGSFLDRFYLSKLIEHKMNNSSSSGGAWLLYILDRRTVHSIKDSRPL